MKNGNAGDIMPVKVNCQADVFENAIREIGVEYACQWFGHDIDSDFTKEIVKILKERSEEL